MPEISLRGRRLAYDVQPPDFDPSLPVVVCIHGSGGDREDWRHQLDGMSHTVTVIALELPGHGASDPPAEISVPAYAQWVTDFVETLGLRRVVLAGCSLGSAIAQYVALSPRPWLLALALTGAGARLKVHPAFLEGLVTNKEFALQNLGKFCLSPNAGESLNTVIQEKYTVESAEVMRMDLSACNDFDIMDRVDQISVPTCIIVGEDDQLTPVKYSRFLEKSISGSQLHVIPAAGHLAMLEKPDEFNRYLTEFLYSAEIVNR